MNYKDTLNLPHTEFPMKANLAALELRILSRWQKLDIYQRLRKERKGRKKFILHDGPPYSNGLIHIGHALNKILKDIVIKYKILSGYDCPFIVGWDCHGLPVEHQLFKELNLTKHDVEISDFRKKAKNYALKFVELQRQDFKRLGVFGDWDNPYLTLSPHYEYWVVKLLEYLVALGYVYRGRKPVNWCPECETALAEAEVEYLDKESDSIYVKFKLKDKKVKDFIPDSNSEEDVHLLVWTTTPWTLISNVAIALHPDLEYCLAVKGKRKVYDDSGADGEYFIFASSLQTVLIEKVVIDAATKVLKRFKGRELEGLVAKHPFLKRESLVVLADFVSREEGSGCVHIAPGHGEEDFSLTKKYNLDVIMPVNDKGEFFEPPEFKGKNVNKAGELVLKKLTENNLLVKHEKITHSYPHCWRCKQPIIFRATFQWFINIDHKNLRKNALKAVEEVRWVPSSGKERMKGMLILRPDWCLSRQRLWGVPIPAIKCKFCQEVILAKEVISKTAEVFKKQGSDSWFTLDLDSFVPSSLRCPNCGKAEFVKEFDILDVWFESGASFLAVVKDIPELMFPADMYLEGSDQHRGWFQNSLIPSVAKEKVAPFKIILTHGFVVDKKGKKMSKSLGNVISPQEVIKEYGAEILRLWAAYSDYSEDVKISSEIIRQLVDMYRKVRNTIRFILGNIHDFSLADNSLSFKDLLEVDRFMLSKAALLYKEVISAYENFSFYKACQKIFNFCNLDLSSFYLDILKDRLYTFSPNSDARRSAQFVLYHILNILLKLIAPILSFTAEEAYEAWEKVSDKKDSIFILQFNEDNYGDWVDEALLKLGEKIFVLRSQVLKEIEKKREEGSIGSSLEAQVIIKSKGKDYNFYSKYKDILREVFIVSSVTIEEGAFEIRVEKAKGQKCLRCWNWSETVGHDRNYPDICSRCSAVLKEEKK